MSTDIQQAALSYFGLPDNARMVEGGAVGEFAFCIGPLTEEQMRGIADRMKAMAEMENPRPLIGVPHVWLHANQLSRKQLLISLGSYGVEYAMAWTDLTEHQRLGRNPTEGANVWSEGAGGREVVHVDAPVDEQDAMPGAVWVPAEDFEDYQLPLASDQRTVDWCVQYLLQEALLTEKQRAKYVKTNDQDAVWVPERDLNLQQILMASDSQKDKGITKHLMQVALLSGEQRHKYAKGGA